MRPRRPHSLRLRLALLTLLTSALGFSSLAYANDFSFGGDAADLKPIKETRLKMASEAIVIKEKARRKKAWTETYWAITATYTFANPTEEAIEATFGFPEKRCDETGDCAALGKERYTFRDMKTSVDGKSVAMRVEEISPESEWSTELGRVHMFDVAVPAGGSIEVVHRYEMGQSGSSLGDDHLHYITKTGALWNGPIGKATFTITLRERPWGFSFPAEYELKEYATSQSGKTTTLRFEMTDWTPEEDLWLVRSSSRTEVGGCPSLAFNEYRLLDKRGEGRSGRRRSDLRRAQRRAAAPLP